MNNEMLENIIRESVDNYINEYSVDRAIENVVKDKIKDKLDTFSNEYIKKKINESIDYVLKGEIDTDDGWGKRKHYDSFEDMFKARFNEKLNTDWEMRRIIETTVKERLDTLFKSKTKEVTQKVQEIVLAEMLRENKDE